MSALKIDWIPSSKDDKILALIVAPGRFHIYFSDMTQKVKNCRKSVNFMGVGFFWRQDKRGSRTATSNHPTDLFESSKLVRIVLNNSSSLPQDNCSFSYHGTTNPHSLFSYKILKSCISMHKWFPLATRDSGEEFHMKIVMLQQQVLVRCYAVNFLIHLCHISFKDSHENSNESWQSLWFLNAPLDSRKWMSICTIFSSH